MVNIYSPSRRFRDHTNTLVYKDRRTETHTHEFGIARLLGLFMCHIYTHNKNIRSQIRAIFSSICEEFKVRLKSLIKYMVSNYIFAIHC